MDGKLGKEYLKNYIAKAKPVISDYINSEIVKAADIGEIPEKLMKSFYEMVTDGKGIRGSLIVLAYQACGGKELDKILDLSTFIEIFHAGVLVQDDFMDRDSLRRGHTTIHKQFEAEAKRLNIKTDHLHYGNTLAACSGDTSFYISWQKLLESQFDPKLLLKAGEIYCKYTIRLVHGQVLDLTSSGNKNITEEEILKVLWTKSGEYTSLLPMMVGATLAGETGDGKLKAIENYARCFGWAFQIQDDYLGIFGEEEATGKPITSDLREGKNTLFVLSLKRLGSKEHLEFLTQTLGNKNVTKADALKLREILTESGAKDEVIKKGWSYVEEGKKYINAITNDQNIRDIFKSLLVFMMERTK